MTKHVSPAEAARRAQDEWHRGADPAGGGAADATACGLTVTAATRGHAVVLAVTGEVDLATATTLASALDRAEMGQPMELVVDLSGLEFIDLAGIRVLEHAADRCVRRGGRLTVEAPHPRTLRILRLAGARVDLVADIRGG